MKYRIWDLKFKFFEAFLSNRTQIRKCSLMGIDPKRQVISFNFRLAIRPILNNPQFVQASEHNYMAEGIKIANI